MKYIFFLIILTIPFISQGNEKEFIPENDTLKIFSWNIGMLPYFIFKKGKKQFRGKKIVEEVLARDYNIIVFQEAFHTRVRNRMSRKLRKKYKYQYGPANREYLRLKTNSGIWVLSDRPLIHKGNVQFDAFTKASANHMARKGAMLFEGEFNGHLFQVLGTHTQGRPIIINNHQFHQIYDGLLEPHYEEGIPQIICGDMNCRSNNPEEYDAMKRIFHVGNPINFLDYTEDENNPKPVERTIDYIFVRENESNIKVQETRRFILGPKWGYVKGIKGKVYGKTIGYSDHPCIDISVTFE